MQDTLRLALVQMNSVADREDNLAVVRQHLAELGGSCDLLVFPENVLCLGTDAAARLHGPQEYDERADG